MINYIPFVLISALATTFGNVDHKLEEYELEKFDPNKFNLPLPEEALKFLDYVDMVDPNLFIRNTSVLDDTVCNDDIMSIIEGLKTNEAWAQACKLLDLSITIKRSRCHERSLKATHKTSKKSSNRVGYDRRTLIIKACERKRT